jgi:MFS transporter, UMF1 family
MLNDKKTIRAWGFYDWANSAYNLIITSAIFPSYFTAIVDDKVQLFGTSVAKASIASWSISLAFLIIACLSPFLSAIADTRANKKSFMRFFCTMGALACLLLYNFKLADGPGTANTWYGITFSIIACIGYCGSIVFYNAYLPEIASKDQQDKVSAKGFIMGYVGSVLLLIVCLSLILGFADYNKAHNQFFVRLSFLLVGIWWLGWSLIPFKVLKDKVLTAQEKLAQQSLSLSTIVFGKLKNVADEIFRDKKLFVYLASFFFATMGVQTTMYMATYFAADVIKLETSQLIITVLLIQIVAIGGAYLTSYCSKRFGNFVVLMVLLIMWIGICYAAAFLVYTPNHFYILAAVVGLIMGGTQSLSRSTFSKLLPASLHDSASFFSFYDLVEKFGIVIGTATFGFVANAVGMRMSAFALGVYFLIALLILFIILRHNKMMKNLA